MVAELRTAEMPTGLPADGGVVGSLCGFPIPGTVRPVDLLHPSGLLWKVETSDVAALSTLMWRGQWSFFKRDETFKASEFGHENSSPPTLVTCFVFETKVFCTTGWLPSCLSFSKFRDYRCAPLHLTPDLLFWGWNLTILFSKLVFDCFSEWSWTWELTGFPWC